MLTIRKLIWDSWNIQHIARHQIIPDEVEAICHNNPVVLHGRLKNRLLLIGKTDEDRTITVVLEPKGKSVYYPITAYPSDSKDLAYIDD